MQLLLFWNPICESYICYARKKNMFDSSRGIIYDTIMKTYKIVIDTNVIMPTLKLRNVYSFKLLSIIDDDRFHIIISVLPILNYEDAIKREKSKIGLNHDEFN